MKIKLRELTDYLETIAPLDLQESYDNAGLIFGDPDAEISSALISLDCTEEIVDEAIALGCQMVISHHPIVFRGIKKLGFSHYVDRTMIKAIQNNIAIYAIHTNLDNVLNDGVNQKIAQKLHLDHLQILRPKMSADTELVGSGIIGMLSQPMTEIDFLKHIRENLGTSLIKHTVLIGSKVQKIAICGGSGSFLLSDAIRAECDFFITADFKYHEYFEANGQIVIADIGHYESEYYTVELIFELLKKKFHKFAAHCTKMVTNPVRYY
jgi:dinuclear metal center YbgI/SA1388 family protein